MSDRASQIEPPAGAALATAGPEPSGPAAEQPPAPERPWYRGHLAATADRWWWAAIGLVLLVGVAGQTRVWASDRGLWNDELYIAMNLREIGFVHLAGRLLYLQVAPPGWLVGEKALLTAFGPDEQVLKLPEVLATVIVLGLTAVAARQAIGRLGAVIATLVVVASPEIYVYAGELKQYAPEAALAMVIIVATGTFGRRALRREPPGRRAVLGYGGVVTVAVAGSYSALVVLAGAAGGLVAVLALRRRWRAAMLATAAVAPGLMLGAYLVLRRASFGFMHNQDRFFPHGFPPAHAGPGGLPRWLPDMWQGFVRSPLGWRFPWLILAVVLIGFAALVLRGTQLWAAIIGGVVVVAVGAAAVRGLPVEGRVALYLVAPVALTVAATADAAWHGTRRLLRGWRGGPRRSATAIAAVLALLLGTAWVAVALAPGADAAVREVVDPRYRDDGRDMLREVAARLQPGDVVLGYSFSEPLLNWYGRLYHLPIVGLATLTAPPRCQPTSVTLALAGARRVWYVAGAPLSHHPRDYTDRVLAELAMHATILETSTQWNPARWALVDLTAGPDPDPPAVTPDPPYACLVITPLPSLS